MSGCLSDNIVVTSWNPTGLGANLSGIGTYVCTTSGKLKRICLERINYFLFKTTFLCKDECLRDIGEIEADIFGKNKNFFIQYSIMILLAV